MCQLNSAAKHGKLLLLPPRTAREVSPSARNIGSPEEAPSSRRRAAFSSSPVPSPGHVGGSSQFVWRRSSAKFRRASARGPRCHARCSKGPTVYRAGLTDGEAFSHSPTSSSNLLAVGRATRRPFFFSFLFPAHFPSINGVLYQRDRASSSTPSFVTTTRRGLGDSQILGVEFEMSFLSTVQRNGSFHFLLVAAARLGTPSGC